MVQPEDYQTELKTNLSNKWWRLNNLYYVINEEGRKVLFVPNEEQEKFFDDLWFLNIILKARQLGFTTFIDIYFLDEVLFNSNVEASIIAHNKEDATKIFRRKVLFPYMNLPDWLREARPLMTRSKTELAFNNGSIISVSTSIRSGTVQYLHISEHGKICRQYPHKAEEIRTGSLNAIHAGQMVCIESTAEGRHGDYFDLCTDAENMQLEGKELSELDFKFHFFPWWKKNSYRLDPALVELTREHKEYFANLETDHGIVLDAEQKAWWVKKKGLMKDKMGQEFPSTSEEAFEATIAGAYYAEQFRMIRSNGQITRVPYDPIMPVVTAWDLGMSDCTSIWFAQFLRTGEIRIIDYYENSGEGLSHYAEVLRDKGYHYDQHIAPHDIEVKELGNGKSRIEKARELGIRFDVAPALSVIEGIDEVRMILPRCWFDKEKCSEGIKALEAYQKEWDDKAGTWKNRPLHDWTSHGSDAFRYLALGHRPPTPKRRPTVKREYNMYKR